ncbi:MAG: RbsD/FucU family protein [Eubacterium sp.]|nr:RbsD/FucU family protein [Eubacterium sp.]
MLKGIPDLLTPDLLKILAEMGHGDRIVIGDCNFPAASVAEGGGGRNIRCDGHRATEVLDAVLQLLPLDSFVEHPVIIMDKPEDQADLPTPVWDEFTDIIGRYDDRGGRAVQFVDRFKFYDLARKSYAVVSTTEHAYYACIILQKGCL